MRYGTVYKNHTYGFCDLYCPSTGEIWEVKRYGNSYTCSKSYAKQQLNNYINNGSLQHYDQKGNYIVGGAGIMGGSFWKYDQLNGDVYRIKYWNAGDGLIYYDYYCTTRKQAYQAAVSAVTIVAAFVVISAFAAPVAVCA